MRTAPMLPRAALAAAAATSLPLLLVGTAQAGAGISVSTVGSSVKVSTGACSAMNADGSFGRASLLAGGRTDFARGSRATLTGTSGAQSAAWTNVGAGTYTVTVVCRDGRTAGTQAVVVSGAPTISATALPSPFRSPSPTPSRGVLGGLGGATKDYGTLTLLGGGVLVATGMGVAVRYLRRRTGPGRH
ncbi:hypothetical protein [Streptomyces sp. CRN 30]|uniref:hypothetical protein n=1 Tax=Streptomyces sp. CRN 30 TaxID=3075613 RepID=UPI002A8381BE|nr:hypothetical protein [Streptomyces sp. CRN 30]